MTMHCKLEFQFDDYKGSVVIKVPQAMSLDELKNDPKLSEYMTEPIWKQNLLYKVFNTKEGKKYALTLYKSEEARMTIEGNINFLGLDLVKVTMLDNVCTQVIAEKQLSLF